MSAARLKSRRFQESAPLRTRLKRTVWRAGMAVGKRFLPFRYAARRFLMAQRTAAYRRICRRTPIDEKLVTFESFMGRYYTDSPKALYEAMLADPRFEDYTFVWAFRSPEDFADVPNLKRATIVKYRSHEHYEVYAKAVCWFSNSVTPGHVSPREGQALVQTWHGTPLKRLGRDLIGTITANAKYTGDEIVKRYENEGRKFTYLLSPSRYATERFSSAFGLTPEVAQHKVLEEGYPRNDGLFTATQADVAGIRGRLGVPEGKKVLLYAPTWRDDQHVSGVGYTLSLPVDFDRLQRELADEYVILFRAHYFVANQFDFDRYAEFVIDVSDVSDINDLYLVSDILITDYSSVFFDYANLKRPIVFFMYDLDAYANEIRGFYLDVTELPGPVVTTEAELVAAIRTAEQPDEALAERYRAFSDRFNYLDDGHASERVLAKVFPAERAAAQGAEQ